MSTLIMSIVVLTLTIHNGGITESVGIVVPTGVDCAELLSEFVVEEDDELVGIAGTCVEYTRSDSL